MAEDSRVFGGLEICIWLEASLKQLERREIDYTETKYYEMGCYNCNGEKKDCEYWQKYRPKKKLLRR